MSKTTFFDMDIPRFGESEDIETKFNDLAKKAAEYLKSKAGNLLPVVHLKGSGLGYYWSVTEKKLVLLPRRAEYYILPWETDEKGKKYLFLPTLLTNGTLLKVLEEDIEYLGFN